MSRPPAAPEDAALVGAALGGDQRAFTEIMGRHKRAVYGFVRRYVGDHDEAHDLVQETFVSAWAALSAFEIDKSMAAWLRRIALNKCRDWSRRRRVRSFFYGATSIEASPRALSASMGSGDREEESMLSALDTSLASLPKALKEPLLLTAIEGLSHKETADLLGVSPKAVESRIYRARRILARELSQERSDR